ncbi:EfeM/EfeO family lipoprotein [Streptomyces tsukubensis]|uniref:Efem/EfeO family lipoprotein n=1 Tax=Streptomyces tsukubensis TaxID=83656 RepID=A0A1V3ZZH5_9ACTN|nr:EfeM/EfeO family lipoprotein [Streptomyces tsukubensis]OON71880.1 Efem/EfeO family lipoprotein [Streptomyces tsukubensis]QFR91831.1 EfeM/EfeO family lipoprotein [Streptomyces tsukubensis]
MAEGQAPPVKGGRRRRRAVAIGAAVAAVCVAGAVVFLTATPDPARQRASGDGLPHTTVEVSTGGCGKGWDRPKGGAQVFDLHSTLNRAAEVYLTDTRTGAVHGEVEGLAPGTSRPLSVTLGNGTYAFRCLPDDVDALTGPTVRVTGAPGPGGPAVAPVNQHDLIPPTISYQKWVGRRMNGLVSAVGELREAIERSDLRAARSRWLTAHLDYERMGAAYGAFGDADGAINGTDAGLAEGVDDVRFTGFHRLEHGLWHGESATELRPVAARLAKDVRGLRDDWGEQRMDPLDLGLRAHEILENTLQFELTARTDFGSGTNLATARANLDGTRTVLRFLRPLLTSRDHDLPLLTSWLDRTETSLDAQHRHGTWTPLDRLDRRARARVDADLGRTVELLADVAAVCDVRRTT